MVTKISTLLLTSLLIFSCETSNESDLNTRPNFSSTSIGEHQIFKYWSNDKFGHFRQNITLPPYWHDMDFFAKKKSNLENAEFENYSWRFVFRDDENSISSQIVPIYTNDGTTNGRFYPSWHTPNTNSIHGLDLNSVHEYFNPTHYDIYFYDSNLVEKVGMRISNQMIDGSNKFLNDYWAYYDTKIVNVENVVFNSTNDTSIKIKFKVRNPYGHRYRIKAGSKELYSSKDSYKASTSRSDDNELEHIYYLLDSVIEDENLTFPLDLTIEIDSYKYGFSTYWDLNPVHEPLEKYAFGWFPNTDNYTITVIDDAEPEPVDSSSLSIVSLTSYDSFPMVTWTLETGASNYIVERALGSSQFSPIGGLQSSSSTTYVDDTREISNLTGSQITYYRIRYIKNGQTSAATNHLSIGKTKLAGPPLLD